MKLPLLPLVLITGISCLGTRPPTDISADHFELAIEMNSKFVEHEAIEVVLTLSSKTRRTFLVSETFGYSGAYFSLEIQDSNSGRTIAADFPEVILLDRPHAICADGLLRMRIDLRQMHRILGGKLRDGPYSFPLAPGRYKLRATYRPVPSANRRPDCAEIDGSIFSRWGFFSILSK